MGNLALCMVEIPKANSTSKKEKKMLQVMKMNDGKLLEFRMSMKVKNLLVNYPNSYVGLFKEATQPLPLEYKLKIGRIYYLFPSFCDMTNARSTCSSIPKPKSGATRIKVVITRHQLQQLLSNRARVESLIMDGKECDHMVGFQQSCLKKLDCIHE
ncbi:hypothetical protein vseg_014778 [Gypsophila vaccaria]